ncbi:hypothetical protein Cgig2_011010 [Carnegiea gigantea]|uniref:Uncharacterized GPI-anchored protein At5g19230-like domain-containing protein n=1 Tax=Carnegiea gigantea TaxID=171969 RepID=A0A9Q1QJS9_9CARY|nr:hypothetical protein Cgig2_011010 [Carnegiea gigantea]
MASFFKKTTLLLLLVQVIILMSDQVKSDGLEDNLLQGINKYRTSLNLTALTKNQNAACLAGEMADQFKDQPCTNSTGANTVPGTEEQLPNYPDLLSHCHLNITNTRDGMVMPACVPNLDPGLVLSNFTESQYSGSLNDTKFTGAGIGSAGNWVVVVLATNDPSGSFETYKGAAFTARPVNMFCLVEYQRASPPSRLLYWLKRGRDEWMRDFVAVSRERTAGNVGYAVGLHASSLVDDLMPLIIRGFVLIQPYFRWDPKDRIRVEVGVGLAGLVVDCNGDLLFDRQMKLITLLKKLGINVKFYLSTGSYHGVLVGEPTTLEEVLHKIE